MGENGSEDIKFTTSRALASGGGSINRLKQINWRDYQTKQLTVSVHKDLFLHYDFTGVLLSLSTWLKRTACSEIITFRAGFYMLTLSKITSLLCGTIQGSLLKWINFIHNWSGRARVRLGSILCQKDLL